MKRVRSLDVAALCFGAFLVVCAFGVVIFGPGSTGALIAGIVGMGFFIVGSSGVFETRAEATEDA